MQVTKTDFILAIIVFIILLFFMNTFMGCTNDSTTSVEADMYEKCTDTMKNEEDCSKSFTVYY